MSNPELAAECIDALLDRSATDDETRLKGKAGARLIAEALTAIGGNRGSADQRGLGQG
jgi:hypothetical protein